MRPPPKRILLKAHSEAEMSAWRLRLKVWKYVVVTEGPHDVAITVSKKGVKVGAVTEPLGPVLAARVIERCKAARRI